MGSVVWLPIFIAGVLAIRFLISEAIVMNACSTLVALLALVSRKGIVSESANSCAQHPQGAGRGQIPSGAGVRACHPGEAERARLRSVVLDLLLRGEVALVADEQLVHTLASIPWDRARGQTLGTKARAQRAAAAPALSGCTSGRAAYVPPMCRLCAAYVLHVAGTGCGRTARTDRSRGATASRC